jgi:hypothetical protein
MKEKEWSNGVLRPRTSWIRTAQLPNNKTALCQGHVAGCKMLGTRAYFVVTRRLCTSQVNTTAGWGFIVESNELCRWLVGN